jgi:predicted ABC-type ATPase
VLTVITGPPCSGKSTYLAKHFRTGDIRIDHDPIAQALGSPTPHDHPDPVRFVAIAARRAAIKAAIAQHHRGARVWIVQTTLGMDALAEYRAAGANIVTMSYDVDELHRRADRERPPLWHTLIDQWVPVTAGRQW